MAYKVGLVMTYGTLTPPQKKKIATIDFSAQLISIFKFLRNPISGKWLFLRWLPRWPPSHYNNGELN